MAALETTIFSFTLLPDTRNMQLLIAGLCLAGALLVGAVVIALMNRWWRRRDAEDNLTPSKQLAQFRSLYDAGQLSKEEFESLRNLLGGQMRESLGMKSPLPILPEVPETPAKPPAEENGQPPENPETGIHPA